MKSLPRLLILLLVLVTLAAFLHFQRKNALSRGSSQGVPIREKVYPDIALHEAQKIVFTDDGKKTVTIEQKEGKFGVAERDGYPVSLEILGQFSTALSDLKIQDKIPAPSPAALQELGVVKPGEGTPEQTGIAVDLYKADNSSLASFVLGTEVKSSGGRQQQSPFGGGPSASQRTLKTSMDKDTVWVVPADFTVEADPKNWIDKKFVNVQKIKRLEVKRPNDAESWAAERKDDGAETKFALLDPKPGEQPDDTKFTTFGTLLSSAYFEDVVPKAEAAAPDFWKDSTEATLTTFEGFTYKLRLKERKDGETTKYLLSVTPDAKFPEKRDPVADEKEEDKKKNDEEFAAKLKTFNEKLALEKTYASWVYVVNDYAVTAVTKKRSDLMKDKPAPAAAPAPGPLPPGIIPPPSPNAPVVPSAPPTTVPPAGTDPAKPGTEPMTDKPVAPPVPAPSPDKPAAPAPIPAPGPETPPAPAPAPTPMPAPEKPAASPAPTPDKPAEPAPAPPVPAPAPVPMPEKPAAPAPAEPAPAPAPVTPELGNGKPAPAPTPAPEPAPVPMPTPEKSAAPAPGTPAPAGPIPETPPGSAPAAPVSTDPLPVPAEPAPLAPEAPAPAPAAAPAPKLLLSLFFGQVTNPVPVEPLPAPIAPPVPLPTPVKPNMPVPVEPLPAPVTPVPEPGKPVPLPTPPLPAPVKPEPEPGKPTPTPVDPLPAPVTPKPEKPVPVEPLPAPLAPTVKSS